MRILVTGITGFVGGHLAEELLAAPHVELVGISRHGDWPAAWRHLAGRVSLRACDVSDGPAVEAVLRDVRPGQIYHLAGYAHVGQSFREPDAAWAGNLAATRCLYDAVARWGGRSRILYVGSGMVYGDADTAEEAQNEDTPLRPASPYAASKAAADLASYQYARSPGLDIVRVRPFNHIGPRQSPQFAVASFARQVAAIERGRQLPVLETGNLTPRRDLTDVRDVVRAYRLLLEHGRTGEAYNVGSGTTCTMQEVVDRLRALSPVAIEVRQRADLVRATETKSARADASRLRRETGWAPRYTLDQTLGDTLAYWRTAMDDRDPGAGRS
jgi:GDP-4-dehydro-6-deoxy-D-mannose reductase